MTGIQIVMRLNGGEGSYFEKFEEGTRSMVSTQWQKVSMIVSTLLVSATFLPCIPSALAIVDPDWTPDPIQTTANIQAAIDSGAEAVRIRNLGWPWIIRDIYLASNQTILFEAGVLIQSDPNWTPPPGQDLITGDGVVNVDLIGDSLNPAKIEMLSPPPPCDQYLRHALSLVSCVNLNVRYLAFKSTCGDGICLVTSASAPNTDIELDHCMTYDCVRGGLSVVNCDGLLAQNCVFEGGDGSISKLGWGVNLEPYLTTNKLTNIDFVNCVAKENDREAFRVWIWLMDHTSTPVDIRFSQCRVENNKGPAFIVNTDLLQPHNMPSGTIAFEYCSAEGVWDSGAVVWMNTTNPLKVIFDNCCWTDVANNTQLRPITIITSVGYQSYGSGIDFLNCEIDDDEHRTPLWVNGNQAPPPGKSYDDLEGTISVYNAIVKKMPGYVLMPNLSLLYNP